LKIFTTEKNTETVSAPLKKALMLEGFLSWFDKPDVVIENLQELFFFSSIFSFSQTTDTYLTVMEQIKRELDKYALLSVRELCT